MSPNITIVMKGAERYIVVWSDSRKTDALRQLGRWAANKDLSFSWYDAALASERIRLTPRSDECEMCGLPRVRVAE